MARGKKLSLEEARRTGQMERFWEEHPSEADRERFEALLDVMSQGVSAVEETLLPDHVSSSSGTRTRRGSGQDDAC